MANDTWDELYRRLEIVPATGPQYLPNLAALDRFEANCGVRLPDSYRGFALRFGPGLLGNCFRMAVPESPFHWVWYDLYSLNQHSPRNCPLDYLEGIQLRKVPKADVSGELERIRRMIFFASLESEEYIGWDSVDLRDPATHEYGVYVLPPLGRPTCCASSFHSFVFDICLGDKWSNYADVDRNEWEEDNRQVFVCIRGQ